MSKRLTIVAYAVNGAGLGHLTRVVAILRWVRRLSRLSGVHPDIYILTSSEACGLALNEGFATFKIPSKTVIKEAQIPKEDYLRLARQWVWHSLGLLRPDILLVDTFPGGSFGELLYALDGTGAKVFVNRAMKVEFQESIQPLLSYYDRILVPQEVGAAETPFPKEIMPKVRYLGPIILREQVELRERAKARQRLGIPQEKLAVWVTAGGGGDPTAALGLSKLVEVLKQNEQLHLIIGAGPLYRGTPLRGANITWITDFNVSEDYLAIDFAFSAAGYNSFYELLHSAVPTAFFAQEKIADEQARRIEAATKAGCALRLQTDAQGLPLDESLAEVLTKFLDKAERTRLSIAAAKFVSQNFAQSAALEILATKLPKATLEEAEELGTPELFFKISEYGLDLELAYEVLPTFGSQEFLDGDERQQLFYQLFESCKSKADLTAKLYLLICQKLAKPTNDLEAEQLVEASVVIINELEKFADERGALAFLRLLPSERQSQPQKVAQELSQFLSKLFAQGESIWRAMALFNQK